MDDHQTPVRIVVKKKRGHGGHHGGAWKVAYADFVTAMMALFIVLWIVGQSEAVRQAVSAYFKDPGFSRAAAEEVSSRVPRVRRQIPRQTSHRRSKD
jgi:flagellar motor protein MotB